MIEWEIIAFLVVIGITVALIRYGNHKARTEPERTKALAQKWLRIFVRLWPIYISMIAFRVCQLVMEWL